MKKVVDKEQVENWIKGNQKIAERITDNKDELTDILGKVNDMKPDDKGPIDGLFDTIKELVQLVNDWKDKKYTDVSKTTIVTVVICFLYLVSPIDLISDVIPIVGFLDDALVIKITLGQIESDLKRYRNWKETKCDMEQVNRE